MADRRKPGHKRQQRQVTQLALRKKSGGPTDRHFAQIQRSAQDLMRMIENL